ncbi:MAG: hypothetical protein ACRDM9_01680 [Gaiellaceae bacterium]
MPPTTWLELEEAQTARTQPARRPPRADRELPAALRAPVTAALVDPTPQPEPPRARVLERHRIALAVLAALACLCLASRALDVSLPALAFGSDPVAGEAGGAVRLVQGAADVNQDRSELASLARLAALERATASTLERERDRSDKRSGGDSEGTPGQGGPGGSWSDSGGQPGPELGLLPTLPAPLPDVDPDDLPDLDPSGTLPELRSVTLPDLDPPLPTVPSPTELP